MKQYRVTKYNPACRDTNGIYLKDEWTDYSDIGKSYDGYILTAEEYYKVENNYIQMCNEVWQMQGSYPISVNDVEKRRFSPIIPKTIKDKEHLTKIISEILECKLWARLEGENFFIHFGYDYYMYIGTILEMDTMSNLASKYNLFCEEMNSPYF